MKALLLSVALLLTFAGDAKAQSSPVVSIYLQCIQSIESGETEAVSDIASKIIKFRYIPAVNQKTAIKCVGAADSSYLFDKIEGRFLSKPERIRVIQERDSARKTLLAEALKTRRNAELVAQAKITRTTLLRAEQKRKVKVLSATVNACKTLFTEDRVAALTSSICNPIFMEIGLPE